MIKILNIQGDEQLSGLMEWVLKGDGFEVLHAREPDATAGHPLPDIILVNTNMEIPEKRVCIDALRSLVPGVRIIDIGIGAEAPGYDTGANAYLGKPFDAVDLVARVRSLTDQAPEPETAAAG